MSGFLQQLKRARIRAWRTGRLAGIGILCFGLLPLRAALPPPEHPSRSLIVEWTPPPPDFRPLPDGTVEVTAGNYAIDEQPGAWRLPFTSVLIAVPPGKSPILRILSAETTSVPLPAPVAMAPRPEVVPKPEGSSDLTPASADPLPAPSAPLALEELGVLRGVRLARILFYPALPEGNQLHIYRHLRVEVQWEPAPVDGKRGDLPENQAPANATDPLLEVVRRTVLNPQDVAPTFPMGPSPSSPRPQGSLREAFLEISRPGLYRVAYAQLAPLGLTTSDPHNLRLFQGPAEVAYEWEGDEDAVFEDNESILFYAEPRFSRWARVDVYRLVADESPGLRMTSRSADPSGLPAGTPWMEETFEDNRLYMPASLTAGLPPGRDGDRWAWDYLTGFTLHPITYTYPFSLSAVDATQPATLTLWAIGHTTGTIGEHRWNLRINHTMIGQVQWTGRTGLTTTLAIPSSVLRSGSNILSVTPVLTSGAWLDAFAVRYARSAVPVGASATFLGASGPRAYTVTLGTPGPYRACDVTDPLRPQRLTGIRVNGQTITMGDPSSGGPRRYHVAAEGAIRAPDRIRPREDLGGVYAAGAPGANYLIITHPALADALGPLVNLRRSQGLSVAVVNILGVYDSWGDGRPDPEAIRRFIAEVYTTWDPRPVHVLLVGDGSYDPKRYRPESPPTFIPPYLADVDPETGETAADNRYVCVDGDDNLPDLLVGRLPVETADEARAVVQKIVEYETPPLPGGWNASVLLVADDPDAAGDFHALSEATAAWVTAPFTVTRRYCPKDACASGAPSLRTALLKDWNQGAFLIQYFGHASWQQWAVERLFHLDDLSALRNRRRYPVLVEMTCFTGAFHRPEPTLDEALVTRLEAGAVAAWGPAGRGVSAGHSPLAAGLFRAVFSDTVGTVGEATLAGKLNLVGAPQGSDLLDTYVLLGDPALRWNRAIIPWASHLYLPMVMRAFPR
ncbi:MAG: C25 family cysteine peptidase [Anaerolineae bacterium]|nr:C25 family cysteine peptidase [Anaerolineae bacterium]MDW8069375.1 C25 family cysteine peptidase [Anaerolineae bacterium]